MIVYRKAPQQLRIQRRPVPEPPFWAATTLAPYSAKRAEPIAIDYLELRATHSERLEVGVSSDVRDELERAPRISDPVLIDASESAEVVFGRGEEALRFCCEHHLGSIHLVSTRGALPQAACERVTVAISAWPLDLRRLIELFREANDRRMRWGVAVPLIFPKLEMLQAVAVAAHESGAGFFAAVPVEIDATARKILAADRDDYDMFFHADLEPLQVATERHIAALAGEIGVADFVVPPRWEEKSNWNAAILLTLVASRMIAMKRDVEIASRIARSARTVAQLEKPLERIAAAASLSIIEALDDISTDILNDWLESGRSAYVDHIDKQWRLRRDVGVV
ncbi:MAG TPA: hypothetical protein VL284_01370 [Thermoanaerobaculia bacterium]|nr:hypothetical protein [Thermoanaerobaculia bacterium]